MALLEDVDAIIDRVVRLYRNAEAALVATIRDAVTRSLDPPTGTEDRLTVLMQLRRNAQDIAHRLATQAGPELRRALVQAFNTGHTSVSAHPERGTDVYQALRQVPNLGQLDVLAQALIRDVGVKHLNILRDTEDVYRQVQAAAAARVATGVATQRQAAQAMYKTLVHRGVTGFVDRRGRRWRLSSYVEMATRTVAMRAAVEGQVAALLSRGRDLVLVSDAVEECALCRVWEHKVLRLTPGPVGRVRVRGLGGRDVTVHIAGTLAEARAAGLMHPNCRHTVSPFLPGVTRIPTHPTADPEGEAARQRQRALERKIRAAKEELLASFTPQAQTAARAKIRQAQQALRDHLAAHPTLHRQRHREQIGAGMVPPPDDTRIAPLDPVPGPPDPVQPEELRSVAQDQRRVLEQARELGTRLAELEQAATRDVGPTRLRRQIRLAERAGLDPGTARQWRVQLRGGSHVWLADAVVAAASALGIQLTPRAGERVVYNPALHTVLRGRLAPGEEALVTRSGVIAAIGGQQVVVAKAQVEPVR